MAVFTILNCGTNYDRSKRGELIADFAANMKGQEYSEFLVTEGPGGSAAGNLMPGTFDPYTKGKTLKSKSPFWSKTPLKTLLDVTQGPGKYNPAGHGFLKNVTKGATYAAITGHGWDDNIRHAIAVLVDRFPNLSATVNMVGWSRGAVTCVRLANWIKEFLGDAWKINIFALDPVPGLDAGEKLADTKVIPDIVADYVAVLAMDEARGDFHPQDLSRITVQDEMKTRVSFLPFPGVHNTVVLQRQPTLPEVTAMVRHLAYKFLSDRGTEFKSSETLLNTQQVCSSYAQMQAKRQSYQGLMKWSFMAKTVRRQGGPDHGGNGGLDSPVLPERAPPDRVSDGLPGHLRLLFHDDGAESAGEGDHQLSRRGPLGTEVPAVLPERAGVVSGAEPLFHPGKAGGLRRAGALARRGARRRFPAAAGACGERSGAGQYAGDVSRRPARLPLPRAKIRPLWPQPVQYWAELGARAA